MAEHFLVTGGLGCLGAWVVRNLVQEGTPVTVFDLSENPHRLRLILEPEELARVNFIRSDITELAAVERALRECAATRVIHLAALQGDRPALGLGEEDQVVDQALQLLG